MNQKPQIKNLLFDLAGVILNLNIERDTEALLSVGLPDFEGCTKDQKIIQPIITYLNGLCSAEDLCQNIRPFCRPDVTDSEIIYSMDAVLDDVPASRLTMLKQLRQKYRVFLLSNLYESAWVYTVNQFKAAGFVPEDCFDQLFLSYEMQLAKPDPEIYMQVCDKTGLIPAETLYFDDTRLNIEAANALGFQTCLVPMNHIEEVLPAFSL